jgi:NAD-dependent dihydropyrimidine dehydrogenase PreA subunit
MDWETYLSKMLDKYDHWLEQGKIKNTAKVIPIGESVQALQWVMPTEQVLLHLRNSRSFALTNCQCRTLARHCDRPLEVCFLINDAGDVAVAKGKARRVSLEEAEERLRLANQSGLVHMTLFNPDQHLFALCNCCPCCCHDLQFLLQKGRRELVAHSEYIAVQDRESCTDCGVCIDRCHFGARVWDQEGNMHYDPAACYGCGLCVTTCPAQAISMHRRPEMQVGSERGAATAVGKGG